MGTTADKLNKVLQTKEAIRTAINNKGGTLTETDKFSDYATAIDNIQSGGSGGGNSLKNFLDRTESAAGLFNGFDGDNRYYTVYHHLNDEELSSLIKYDDTSNVTNMRNMLYDCGTLTTIPQLDTSKVTNMKQMFSGCSNLITIPQLNTSSCTDMSDMFYSCRVLTTIPQLDTSKVTNMEGMFSGCSILTTIPQLDTSSCTTMKGMFSYCYKIIHIPQLDTSKVTNMNYMFERCDELTTIDLTHMNITTTSNSNYFAYKCYSLTKLIIRNMDTIPTLNSNSFNNCYHFYGTQNDTYNPSGLKDGRIYVPDNKVEELKTATNWSVFADIIVPLSTLVEE